MKKITLLLFLCFSFWNIKAQMNVSETFDTTTTPAGWTYTGFGRTTSNPCNGVGALRFNYYSTATTASVITPNFTPTNGGQIDVSFNWKSTEWSSGSGVGVSMNIDYSVDNGTNWINMGNITTASITTCSTWSGSLPAGAVTSGSGFGLRFNGTHTGGDCYFYIDDVAIFQASTVPPSCTVLTTPANGATNVLSTNIVWAAAGGATGYKLNVGTTPGGTDVLNMYDAGNILNNDFGVLSPGTTYYVTVIPYNAIGDAVGPCTESSFTTCGSNPVPVIEGFAIFLPSCWQEATGGDQTVGPDTFGSSAWGADGFANSGTTGSFSVNIWYDSKNEWVISPLYNIPASGSYELKFDAAATQYGENYAPTDAWEADDYVEVLISNGTDNWTVLYTYNDGNVPSNSGVTNIINLSSYLGQNVRFAFRAVEGVDDGDADIDFFIDNFEVRATPTMPPTCATNIVATPNATCGNFATTLSWNAVVGADGYRIKLGTTIGGTEILNNFDLGPALTYNYSGNINTTYYFTIIPYNVNGSAIGCSEVSYVTNINGCYCSSNPSSNDGAGITNVTLGSTNFPTTDVTYFNHTATIVDLAQSVNSNVQITFATGYTYDTNIWIDFNNDFDFDDAGELVKTGIASTTANPTTLNASFTMPGSAPLGQHRMRIGTADDGQVPPDPCYSGEYGVTLDFVVNILAAPSCIPPTSLSANTTSSSSASLSWIAMNSENSWNVEYGVTGFLQGTGTVENNVLNPHSVTTLSPNTSYQFYVQANCGGSGSSTWVGPYTFTTPCVALNTPYTQDFESVTTPALPACTSVVNSGLGNTWATASAPGTGFTTKVLRYGYNFTNAANTWFFTQGVNLTGGVTYRISYNYGNNDSGYTEQMKVAYGTTANSAAMTNIIADHTTINQNAIQTSQVDFVPATTGVYYFGFQAHSIANQYNLYLDNISVTDPALSIENFSLEGFKAYPNPVKDVLNLSYTKEISKVSVHNLLGQEVLSKSVNAMQSQVDLSRLAVGTYLVKVTVDGLENAIKIVKE